MAYPLYSALWRNKEGILDIATVSKLSILEETEVLIFEATVPPSLYFLFDKETICGLPTIKAV